MNWESIFIESARACFSLNAVVYCLAAIGLNVHFGYTGLLNFGQAAFLAVGAYGLAVSVTTFGLPFLAGIAVGIGCAVVLALLLGIPTLRLRADYLAIVTIAAAEIVRLIFRAVPLKDTFGGSDGLKGFSEGFYALNPFDDPTQERRYGIAQLTFSERDFWVLSVGWTLVALSCLLLWMLMRSPWGRVLKAIREDEDAVRSLGKNVYSYKMQSLILGGVLGSFGGFIWALGQASVQPDSFGTETTFFAYTILLLGGAARVFGPVVGAMIFWGLFTFFSNSLNNAVRADIPVFNVLEVTQVGRVTYMMVGLALVLLMIFRPQGIFGNRREIALDAR